MEIILSFFFFLVVLIFTKHSAGIRNNQNGKLLSASNDLSKSGA